MKAPALFALLQAAKEQCGHSDYVVIGSLSILGLEQVMPIPTDMTMSIDADCYTRADPGRIFDLARSLGEGSAYHRQHGIYLDPISPDLPTLPPHWQQRLIRISQEGINAYFLEPNDAAISKLARGQPRDQRWVRAGISAGVISVATVTLRMRETAFLDDQEHRRAREGLALAAT